MRAWDTNTEILPSHLDLHQIEGKRNLKGVV